MPQAVTASPDTLVSPRLIGSYTQQREGNLLIVIGGIHGNEVSGVLALKSLFRYLEETRPSFRGKVVGISGNLAALAAGQRFIDQDLNRNWGKENLARLREQGLAGLERSEDREAFQLMQVIDQELADGPWTDRIFVDLHATSAAGGGFSIIQDTEANREIASRMHLPLIFGIEKKLQATLMNHLYEQGMNGVVFEGGQIGSQDAIDVHEAGLWTLITSLGCLHPKDVPDFRFQINRMIDAAEGLPKAVRAVYRHAIEPTDEFRMLPGFVNFQTVACNQHIANDRTGTVHAPFDGLLLMPLYQAQGEDGFFIVEPVDY